MQSDCPFCRDAVSKKDSSPCSICGTLHHHACWNVHHKCSVFGCTGGPEPVTGESRRFYKSFPNLLVSCFVLFLFWFYASGVAWEFFEVYWKQSVMITAALVFILFSID